MIRIFHNTSFDFIKWWRQAAIATIAFILIGLVSFLWNPSVNYSIEFTGGTLIQLEFTEPPRVEDIRAAVEPVAPGSEIQQFGSNLEYTIRAQDREQIAEQASAAEGVARRIETALQERYGADVFSITRREAVGPKVGSELRRGAIIAMLLASLVTLAYLAVRFEWRFSVAAVLSTGHDVLVTFAFIKLMNIEVSLVVVAAILTLLGYSGNDTIIIFDRVRENLRKTRKEPLYDTLNRSINETLPRSVLTHTTTVAATLAILFFAGEVLRPFALVLTFGVIVATFSSMYVASPLLLWIERRYPRAVAGRAQVSASQARATSTSETPPARSPSRPSRGSAATR